MARAGQAAFDIEVVSPVKRTVGITELDIRKFSRAKRAVRLNLLVRLWSGRLGP